MAKVLSIDDDSNLQDLLSIHLTKRGHTVEWSFSGEDGLAKAETLRPDIILTDLMLPGLNGIEVIKLLKANEKLRAIPVIVLTAYAADEPFNETGARAVGAAEFVRKPVDFKNLADLVEARLNGGKPGAGPAA